MSVFAFVSSNVFILLGIKGGGFCDPISFFEFHLLFTVNYVYSFTRFPRNPNFTMDVRLLHESCMISFLFHTIHLDLSSFHFSVVETTLFVNNLGSLPFLKWYSYIIFVLVGVLYGAEVQRDKEVLPIFTLPSLPVTQEREDGFHLE